jgi:hypothetical protein
MGAIRLREGSSDLCERLDLILEWLGFLDRYWLLSQPSADCSKIVFRQVIEVDSAHRAHRVTVLHVFGKLVRVREDYAVRSSFCESEERRYLRVGEVGAL